MMPRQAARGGIHMLQAAAEMITGKDDGNGDRTGGAAWMERNGTFTGTYLFLNGNGTMIYPDGSTYSGYWKEDLRNGTGNNLCQSECTATYPDGTKYVGEWIEGKMHGWGITSTRTAARTAATGRRICDTARARTSARTSTRVQVRESHGRHIRGRVGERQAPRQGYLHLSDGRTYKGDVAYGKRQGKGVLTFDDGSVEYKGNWATTSATARAPCSAGTAVLRGRLRGGQVPRRGHV